MKKVTFMGTECMVKVYEIGGNLNIQLITADDGQAFAKASTSLGISLPKGQVYIKSYSENEGMLECLQEAGLIKRVIRWDTSGFVKVPLVELNMSE